MGFQTRTSVTYEGGPSYGKAKVRIDFSTGFSAILTDSWVNYPISSMVLHPDHLPQTVIDEQAELLKELHSLRDRGARSARPEDIALMVMSAVYVGMSGMYIKLTYGRMAEPSRAIVFPGIITGITPL